MHDPLFDELFPPDSYVAVVNPGNREGFRLTVVRHTAAGLFGRARDGKPAFVPTSAPLMLFAVDGPEADDEDDAEDDLAGILDSLSKDDLAAHTWRILRALPQDARHELHRVLGRALGVNDSLLAAKAILNAAVEHDVELPEALLALARNLTDEDVDPPVGSRWGREVVE